MNWLDILILGIVQGLTEFLPVSSTGHLEVAQSIMGFGMELRQSLDIFLHLPTVLAVIVFFRRDIANIARNLFTPANPDERRSALHLIAMIVIGIVSTTVVYFLLRKPIDNVFGETRLIGFAFIFTAAFLAAISFKGDGLKSEGDLKPWHAVFIGVAQAIAITPGVSRSGITICAALLIGMNPKAAFRFSFLLSIPTIILAWVYDVLSNPGALTELGCGAGSLTIGFVAAFASALFAVYLLKGAVLRKRLWWFSIYLLPAGILTLLFIGSN